MQKTPTPISNRLCFGVRKERKTAMSATHPTVQVRPQFRDTNRKSCGQRGPLSFTLGSTSPFRLNAVAELHPGTHERD